MNAPAKVPLSSSIVQRLPILRGRSPSVTPTADHLEFLPANLEILETPSSPKASLFLWGLCAFLTALLLWSWFAHLDIHAIAKGRIQPSGRSKVIQPLEAGRVLSIMVTNGQRVKADDVLIEMDPTETFADRNAYMAQLESLDAEIVRRAAAIEKVRTGKQPELVFPDSVSTPIREREERALMADIGQYEANRDTLLAQRGELDARTKRLNLSIESREKLIASLQERVNMRETLASTQSGTRAAVIDALQMLQGEQTSLAYDQGQLIETVASSKLNESRVSLAMEDFIAKQTQQMVDAQRKRSDVQQLLIKADARAGRTRLVAPIDGVVQQLAVTTVGQVVTTGQPLMVVVPLDGPLEVEALVENQDIAFVRPGQEVVIKVDSLPFTRYGTIDGVVTRISSDSVDQRDAASGSDAATAVRGMNSATLSGVSRVQNLVYPVTIQLKQLTMKAEGRDVQLGPGMMVTAEVRTGSRRVIDYLLSPIREVASQAGRER